MAHTTWGIVLASGKGEQLTGGIDTAFLSLGTHPAITYSMMAFEKCAEVDEVMILTAKDRIEAVQSLVKLFGCVKTTRIVGVGSQRAKCIQTALDELPDNASVVVIQEASRPCISVDLVAETVRSAKRYGTGIAGHKLSGSVKVVPRGLKASSSKNGNTLWVVHTPQAYKIDVLQKALKAAAKKHLSFEDESEAVALTTAEIRMVPSPSTNVKIQTPDDLTLVSTLLRL
ncbi:MAG: 2-C-methyl-D-erythritol 4-phosphate cytidylyltransferase [Verrucomicrobia bacterium]|nr:2-C-methyl-D-erythritol 4-phosphate cytidylyltransferase [Verrucomicrobiota bacterium]